MSCHIASRTSVAKAYIPTHCLQCGVRPGRPAASRPPAFRAVVCMTSSTRARDAVGGLNPGMPVCCYALVDIVCKCAMHQVARCTCLNTRVYVVLTSPHALLVGMQGQVDPVYLAGATFLKGIGMKNTAEIARVLDIAMNPNSLFVQYNDAKRSKNANVSMVDFASGSLCSSVQTALSVIACIHVTW